ncbi:Centrosomal protein poc5 [Podochytrium sp. JEL0797]|nr:Centrosomal protein poc5 [Podochytrium sp. JEL0797]
MDTQHANALEESGRVYVETVQSLTARVRDLENVVSVCREKMEARNLAVEGCGTEMVKMHNKTLTLQLFHTWRTKFKDAQRLHLAERMAASKGRTNALRRALFGWQRVCGVTWRKAVEKSIRVEAERAMHSLSLEYESKLRHLTTQLVSTQTRLTHSEQDRTRAQGEMKKALMRGVCALNMEAMSVFRGNVGAGGGGAGVGAGGSGAGGSVGDYLSDLNAVFGGGGTGDAGGVGNEADGGGFINVQPIPRGQRGVVVGDFAGKMFPETSAAAVKPIPVASGQASPIVANAVVQERYHQHASIPAQPLFLKKHGFESGGGGGAGKSMDAMRDLLEREEKGGVKGFAVQQRKVSGVSESVGRMDALKRVLDPPPLVQKAPPQTSVYRKRRGDAVVGVHVERHS